MKLRKNNVQKAFYVLLLLGALKSTIFNQPSTICNPKSAILNPHSAFSNPQSAIPTPQKVINNGAKKCSKVGKSGKYLFILRLV
jgi:hypothetical protein